MINRTNLLGLIILMSTNISCVLTTDALPEQFSLKEIDSSSTISLSDGEVAQHLRATSFKELREEREKRKKAGEERQKGATADAELPAPTDAETACTDDVSACVVIDRGCCLHEKRVAVNLKSAKELEKKRATACKEFFETKIIEKDKHKKKENITKRDLAEIYREICGGRKKLGHEREEKVICKKDLEKPVYSFNPKEEVKYKEDLKKYKEAPGKCVMSLASQETDDTIKTCKVSGTMASFEIRCSKVITYFQTGNASHAKELKIEKDGKSITIERVSRTSLKGVSSGHPKLFIIVVHPDESSTDLVVN